MNPDFLSHLIELKQGQARLETKIDALDGLPGRVTSLEHDRTRFKAIGATIGGVAGAVGGAMGWFFSHFQRIQ